MCMSMGFSMSMSFQQRLELAQRLVMRQELRMVIEQRMQMSLHEHMDLEGVEDPLRVRYFEFSEKKGKITPFVAKMFDKTMVDECYLEAANQLRMKECGLAVPEVVGVMQTDNKAILVSEFVRDSASIGTLLSNPEVAFNFYKKHINKYISNWSEHDVQAALQAQKIRSAYLIGNEVGKMHEAGILKKDLVPRNFLVTVGASGDIDEMKIWQTGFGHVEFKEVLTRKEKMDNLKQLAADFDRFESNHGLQCEFLRGYFGKYSQGIDGITDILDEEKDIQKQTGDGDDIRRKVKTRLSVLLGNRGYVAAAEGTEEVEVVPDLSRQIEQYVLNCPEEELNCPYYGGRRNNRAGQIAFQKVVQMIRDVLQQQKKGCSYQDVRSLRVLDYLFACYVDYETVSQNDIENCDDVELRMHVTTASRLVAPILKKLNLPDVGFLPSYFDQCTVLRLKLVNLEAIDQALVNMMYDKFTLVLARRTVSKYRNILQEAGKFPKLEGKHSRRLRNHFNNVMHSGGTVSLEEFSRTLGLPESDLDDYLGVLVRQYLDKQITNALANGRLDQLDEVELAMKLNLPISDVMEKVEKNRGRTSALIEAPETIIARTGEALMDLVEEAETQPPVVEEVEPAAEVQPIVEVQPPVQVSAQPEVESSQVVEAPQSSREEPAVMPVTETIVQEDSSDRLTELVVGVAAQIQEDPACSSHQLANDLGVSIVEIDRVIATLEATHQVPRWRQEVNRLIRTRPHIQDEGLIAELGVDLLTVHLCVRPMLLSGAIRI